VVAAAFLMALSPAMVFYSRMYIQESLFTCFTLAFVIAIGRMTLGGGLRWSVAAGLAGGLAVATKETSLIVLPAAILACAVSWLSLGPARRQPVLDEIRWGAAGLAVAALVAAIFFSSFLVYPAGVLAPFGAIGTYLDRGVDPANHAHPWHYYLGLLAYSSSGGRTWTEAVVLGLALVGAEAAWNRPDRSRPERVFWARYLACYVALAALIFSAIRYKTPWNLLPFYVGVLSLAGFGFSRLLHLAVSRAERADAGVEGVGPGARRLKPARYLARYLEAGWLTRLKPARQLGTAWPPPLGTVVVRGALTVAFVAALAHLGVQAWRASVTYAADPRNPYVYAQTVPDAVRMAARIRDLAARHPDGARMQVSVVAPPHEQWPLPWYLRSMPNVGYWTDLGDPLIPRAPVIVAAMDHTQALDTALGDRYVSEFYGLRPEVLLALYIERGLWDRFLATVADRGAGPSRLMAPPAGQPSTHSRHQELAGVRSGTRTVRVGVSSEIAPNGPRSAWGDEVGPHACRRRDPAGAVSRAPSSSRTERTPATIAEAHRVARRASTFAAAPEHCGRSPVVALWRTARVS
jgi:uncharacterized protein (TIGR03663 family)